jgi:hypothetical protein
MNEIKNENKYLKSDQYYSDLYDKFTVEECRRVEDDLNHHNEVKVDKNAEGFEKMAKSLYVMTDEIKFYFIKGERYANKKDTIRDWISRDGARDELLERAKAPENITCLTCGRLVFVTSKDLWPELNKEDRVLFMYECPLKHFPMRCFYNNGEERRIKPDLCPKCSSELKHTTDKQNKEKIIIINTCSQCGYEEKDEFDLTTSKEEKIDLNFAKDRERFCLSEEEGQKYLDGKYRLKAATDSIKEFEEKEKNKELYEKVSKLKKLKIVEVEQLLAPALEAQNYMKLQFQAPEIKRDIIVPFSIHDAKDRQEYQSMADLKKAIKNTLEGTNWKLMSDGVSYRLGMLSGRLRGYDHEEDLLELVK